jgi:hypothetical protein
VARTGGRNSWIAVPAGLLCAGIVAGLVWLAQPMLPVTLQWAGETLREASSPPAEAALEETPAQRAAAGRLDCRALYPPRLWRDMVWTGGTHLSQTTAAPATSATAVVDALQPDVRVTCTWRLDAGGTVATTLAVVGGDAALLADAALRGQGFACTADADAVRCTRTQSGIVEAHTVREGLWLSSVETRWHPADYTERLEEFVWG